MPEESTTATPQALTGIDAMMAQLDAAAASGGKVEPKPAEATPQPKPGEAPAAPAAPAKPADPKPPEAKPAAAPAAPAAAAKPEEAEPDWSKAPPKWYKIYETHKQKTGETIKSLEAKIKQLETKPFEQPGDAKKLETYEKQLEAMRGENGDYKKRLAQLDYTSSDEYRIQFREPANAVYKEAVEFVSRLKVQDGDNTRAATQADFDYLRNLPIDARRKAANEMFGEMGPDVLDFTREIDRIKRNAQIAADRHSQDHEKIALEREGTTKQQQAKYEELRKASLETIKSNEAWGKWFREDEADPEASKLISEGYAEIEKVTAQIDKLPMDQQAAYSALYMARAAAAPRLILEINRITAKYEAVMEELEKIRGTDPGAKPIQAGAAPSDTAKPVGIEGAAAVFDQMPR